MRNVPALIWIFSSVFFFIELSFQFECLPNGEPLPVTSRGRPPASPERNDLTDIDADHPNVQTVRRFRSRSRSAEPPAHLRSKFPSTRSGFLNILGYDFEEIGLIRLIPNRNSFRRFKVQKYTFPTDKPIRLRGVGRHNFTPMPTDEQIVLTTATGDVVAIVENNSILRGIYDEDGFRAGINMSSGSVFQLTLDLANETPLGRRSVISKNFKIIDVNAISPYL